MNELKTLDLDGNVYDSFRDQVARNNVPRIGENGNWWIGDTDTGVSAGGSGGGVKKLLSTITDGTINEWEFTGLDCTTVLVAIKARAETETMNIHQAVYINGVQIDYSRMLRTATPTAVNTYTVIDNYVKMYIEFGSNGFMGSNEGTYKPYAVGDKINTFKFVCGIPENLDFTIICW